MVFFRSARGGYMGIGHVGIYVGNDNFIHAPSRGKPIQIAKLSGGWYTSHYVGAKRIRPDFF